MIAEQYAEIAYIIAITDAIACRKKQSTCSQIDLAAVGARIDTIMYVFLCRKISEKKEFLKKRRSQMLEWEIIEDDYQEKIHIPKTIADDAKDSGIGIKSVVARITNEKTGEEYLGRMTVTGTEIYVPVEIQKMLKRAGTIRIRIF